MSVSFDPFGIDAATGYNVQRTCRCKIVDFLDVFEVLKTASRKPDSPAERKTFPNPKVGPVRGGNTDHTDRQTRHIQRKGERKQRERQMSGAEEKIHSEEKN